MKQFSFCMLSTAYSQLPLCPPQSHAAVHQSTYADETTKKCCFQSPNLIFGAFRYLTDITMFLCLKRKAVNIRAL